MSQYRQLLKPFLFLLSLNGFNSVQAVPDIQLNAILGKKIITTVDGQQYTLKEGDSIDNGLKVQEVNSREVTFIWQGEQFKLEPSSRISTSYTEKQTDEISIRRDASSHYLIMGSIDDRSVQFVVDTGATYISMSGNDADRLGVQWRKSPQVAMNTAAGVVTAYAVHLNKVTINGISVYQVEAVVIPQQHSPILLGMSFLHNFDMNESNNVLVLKKRF